MQSDICRQFHENPKRNPRTGKALHYGKKPYLDLVEECGKPGLPGPTLDIKDVVGEPPIIVPQKKQTIPKKSQQIVMPTIQPLILDLPQLPAEIILEEIIMKNKDIRTFVATCSANSTFQKICRNEDFWKKLYYKYYGDSEMLEVLQQEQRFISWYELVKLCFSVNNLIYLLHYYEIDRTIKGLYLANEIAINNKDKPYHRRKVNKIPPEIRFLFI
jgi:hypothetical protein